MYRCLFYDLNELDWNSFVTLACFTNCHRFHSHSHSVKYWSSHHETVCKMKSIIIRHTIMNGFKRQKPLRHDKTIPFSSHMLMQSKQIVWLKKWNTLIGIRNIFVGSFLLLAFYRDLKYNKTNFEAVMVNQLVEALVSAERPFEQKIFYFHVRNNEKGNNLRFLHKK